MSTKLWYNQYVDNWMHALPLGNGRVGAMFYGKPQREVIEINEESLWSGRQIQEKNHAAPEILARIRELIFEDRLQEAAQLSGETFLADPPRVRFFESMGEVFVGVKSRGGFMFDIAWEEGKLTQVTVTATSEGMLQLKLPAYQLNPTANVAYTVKDSVLSYPCKENETVTLRFS